MAKSIAEDAKICSLHFFKGVDPVLRCSLIQKLVAEARIDLPARDADELTHKVEQGWTVRGVTVQTRAMFAYVYSQLWVHGVGYIRPMGWQRSAIKPQQLLPDQPRPVFLLLNRNIQTAQRVAMVQDLVAAGKLKLEGCVGLTSETTDKHRESCAACKEMEQTTGLAFDGLVSPSIDRYIQLDRELDQSQVAKLGPNGYSCFTEATIRWLRGPD